VINKNQAKKIRKTISETIKTRWTRNRRLKCGKGGKTMTTEQVNQFFNQFQPHEYRYKTLFLTQCLLGLRIGETITIKQEDLNFNNKKIKIHTLKKHGEQIDYMPLHDKIYTPLLDYTNTYEKQILQHNNYIFFSDHNKGKGHISAETARRKFAEIRERASLTENYGYYEQKNQTPIPKKPLYYITTHSLRHAFGKLLANNAVPPIYAKHLLRHDSLTSTEIYYIPDKEKIDKTLTNLFKETREYP